MVYLVVVAWEKIPERLYFNEVVEFISVYRQATGDRKIHRKIIGPISDELSKLILPASTNGTLCGITL